MKTTRLAILLVLGLTLCKSELQDVETEMPVEDDDYDYGVIDNTRRQMNSTSVNYCVKEGRKTLSAEPCWIAISPAGLNAGMYEIGEKLERELIPGVKCTSVSRAVSCRHGLFTAWPESDVTKDLAASISEQTCESLGYGQPSDLGPKNPCSFLQGDQYFTAVYKTQVSGEYIAETGKVTFGENSFEYAAGAATTLNSVYMWAVSSGKKFSHSAISQCASTSEIPEMGTVLSCPEYHLALILGELINEGTYEGYFETDSDYVVRLLESKETRESTDGLSVSEGSALYEEIQMKKLANHFVRDMEISNCILRNILIREKPDILSQDEAKLVGSIKSVLVRVGNSEYDVYKCHTVELPTGSLKAYIVLGEVTYWYHCDVGVYIREESAVKCEFIKTERGYYDIKAEEEISKTFRPPTYLRTESYRGYFHKKRREIVKTVFPKLEIPTHVEFDINWGYLVLSFLAMITIYTILTKKIKLPFREVKQKSIKSTI